MSDCQLKQTAPDMSITDAPRALRENAVRILKSMNTLAGSNVESSRALPVKLGSDPLIIVYTPSETSSWVGDAPPGFETTCKLTVIGYVSGSPLEKIEAQTDLLKYQIKSLLNQVAFFNPPCERVQSMDIKEEFKGDADRFEGYAIVEFDIKYLEIFEPNLASLTGTTPPGAAWAPPPGPGAVFNDIALTITSAAGETLTGATISIINTLSVSS